VHPPVLPSRINGFFNAAGISQPGFSVYTIEALPRRVKPEFALQEAIAESIQPPILLTTFTESFY
jgi:hypothetical protein